jgi:hypothetical protein
MLSSQKAHVPMDEAIEEAILYHTLSAVIILNFFRYMDISVRLTTGTAIKYQ